METEGLIKTLRGLLESKLEVGEHSYKDLVQWLHEVVEEEGIDLGENGWVVGVVAAEWLTSHS